MNEPAMTLFTTSEAARHLEISVATVRRYEGLGKLIAIKTGRGQRLFTVEELQRFIRWRADSKRKAHKTSQRKERT